MDWGGNHEQRLIEALEPFANVRDQMPQTVKLISKRLDGLTPITVTVTKAQFLAAVKALALAKGEAA